MSSRCQNPLESHRNHHPASGLHSCSERDVPRSPVPSSHLTHNPIYNQLAICRCKRGIHLPNLHMLLRQLSSSSSQKEKVTRRVDARGQPGPRPQLVPRHRPAPVDLGWPQHSGRRALRVTAGPLLLLLCMTGLSGHKGMRHGHS